jgi:hypothetical protein
MFLTQALSTLAVVQVALASPQMFSRRAEEGTRCEEPTKCVYSYTTGSAQCSSGFTRSDLEAKGSPPGSYCERQCTDEERKACTAKNCEN